MRISAAAILLLVVINTVSGSTDSVYQYLEEDWDMINHIPCSSDQFY